MLIFITHIYLSHTDKHVWEDILYCCSFVAHQVLEEVIATIHILLFLSVCFHSYGIFFCRFHLLYFKFNTLTNTYFFFFIADDTLTHQKKSAAVQKFLIGGLICCVLAEPAQTHINIQIPLSVSAAPLLRI